MEKIHTLTEANRYLEAVGVNVWELEERVCLISEPQPRTALPFPEFVPAKSIHEALYRLKGMVKRRSATIRFFKELPKDVQKAEMDHWRKERETFKEFNCFVQGDNPPHL